MNANAAQIAGNSAFTADIALSLACWGSNSETQRWKWRFDPLRSSSIAWIYCSFCNKLDQFQISGNPLFV